MKIDPESRERGSQSCDFIGPRTLTRGYWWNFFFWWDLLRRGQQFVPLSRGQRWGGVSARIPRGPRLAQRHGPLCLGSS